MEAHPEYDASLPSLYLSSQPRGSNQTPRIQGKTRKKKLKAAENCNSRFHPCATESTHTPPNNFVPNNTYINNPSARSPRKTVESISPATLPPLIYFKITGIPRIKAGRYTLATLLHLPPPSPAPSTNLFPSFSGAPFLFPTLSVQIS